MHNIKYLKNVVIITGPARSGTSILGKILASCNKTEYWYEPETFQYIATIYNKISKEIWHKLYSRYVTENLLRLITGRSINLKKNENSSISSYKSQKEINSKLKNNLSELDLENFIKKNKIRLVIKSPNLELKQLAKVFTKYKIVFTIRDHYEVINSIIKRNWFKGQNYLKTFLPPVKIMNKYYPIWMKKKYLKYWRGSNEETKCAIYILCCYEEVKNLKGVIYYNYEDSINFPKKTASRLIKKLGLKFSKKTIQILKKIKQPKSNIKLKKNLIRNKINPKVLKLLEKV
tara:strand:- start:5214 stop:6080 length:867 start_codon:yes stop_codon:yes gene_type:complete